MKVFQIIISNKKLIIKLFWALMIGAIGFFVFSINSISLRSEWLELGRWAGDLASVLFVLAVLPGILKRFKVTGTLQQWQVLLMAFRRQFGIGMYVLGLMHSNWVSNLIKIKTGLPPFPINNQELLGSLALFLALPLFLTSNDWSQRVLGKNWYLIHKLVYVIVWLIAAHIALLKRFEIVGLLIWITGALEVLSRFYGRNKFVS